MTVPKELAGFLNSLRAEPRFFHLLQAMPRTRPVSWRSLQDDPKAEAKWAYHSGKLDAEKAILIWLLGDEPDSRQSG